MSAANTTGGQVRADVLDGLRWAIGMESLTARDAARLFDTDQLADQLPVDPDLTAYGAPVPLYSWETFHAAARDSIRLDRLGAMLTTGATGDDGPMGGRTW